MINDEIKNALKKRPDLERIWNNVKDIPDLANHKCKIQLCPLTSQSCTKQFNKFVECSREINHKGKHHAHGLDNACYVVW